MSFLWFQGWSTLWKIVSISYDPRDEEHKDQNNPRDVEFVGVVLILPSLMFFLSCLPAWSVFCSSNNNNNDSSDMLTEIAFLLFVNCFPLVCF